MISRVLLENWRSHKHSELHFEKGTNVLVGVMGSGKTSIMDSVCFALFGTFPALKSKLVSIDEIVLSKPNKAGNARVELEFDFGKDKFLVERTIFADGKSSQAKLLVNGKLKAGPKPTEVSKEIERLLEIDFELFSRAIYSEQNQLDFFLRLSPQERKKAFDELLELDKYETVRSNAVQVLNYLKKNSLEKKKTLEGLEKSFKKTDISELAEKIALKEKELLMLEKKTSAESKELNALERQFKEAEAKKTVFERLQSEILKNSGKLEELQKALQELMPEIQGLELAEEKISSSKKSLDEKLAKIQQAQQFISSLKNEIEVLNGKKLFFESQIKADKAVEPRSLEELKKAAESNRALEIKLLEQELAIEEQASSLKAEKGRLEGSIFEQKALIEEISSLEKEVACPTCRRKLDSENCTAIISEASLKVSQLEKSLSTNASNIANIEAKKKQLMQESETAKQSKTALEKSFEILERIKENEGKASEAGKQALEKQNILEAKSLEFSEKEADIIMLECKKLEKALDAARKKKSIERLESCLKEAGKKIKELSFSQEFFEELGKKTSEKKSSIAVSSSKVSSLKEALKELNSRFKEVQELQEKLGLLEKEAGIEMHFSEKLGVFVNALSSTQGELRSFLIEAVNSAMNDVWPRVYPYKDFSSARIEIQEGNYEISALDRSGKWTRVEGILSGGERMAAAITIRVAFSLVLAQQLSWLILDEPTHNLDSNAVQVLSEMLKEHLPQLVEQVFVITHDKELEKAASSKVFELLRNKDEDGVSQVVEKAI